MDLRHSIALIGSTNSANLSITSRPLTNVSSQSSFSSNLMTEKKLQILHDSTFKLICEQIKNVLANLQAFLASDVSFSAKVHFNEPFCKEYVRERLLVPYLKHIAQSAREYAEGLHDPIPYALLLILSRLCLEFESVAVDYLVILTIFFHYVIEKNAQIRFKKLICSVYGNYDSKRGKSRNGKWLFCQNFRTKITETEISDRNSVKMVL